MKETCKSLSLVGFGIRQWQYKFTVFHTHSYVLQIQKPNILVQCLFAECRKKKQYSIKQRFAYSLQILNMMKSFNFFSTATTFMEATEIVLKLRSTYSPWRKYTFLWIFTEENMVFCYLILLLFVKTHWFDKIGISLFSNAESCRNYKNTTREIDSPCSTYSLDS